MLCEKCGKHEAVIFYKENLNGTKKSLSLCEKCAKEAESAGEIGKIKYGDPLADMNSLFGSLFGVTPYTKRTQAETKKCTLCGSVFSDLVKTGKAGCPECYNVFAEELAPTIAKIHGSTKHNGSLPERFREGREKKEKIKSLELQLKEAIASEEYEKAALIRDELKILRADFENA